jgi:hypothetical protein
MKDTRRSNGWNFTPRGRLQVTVEVGRSADDEDMLRLRLQPQGHIEGRAEDASDEESCHAGWERGALDGVGVSPAEHDWHAWSERVAVSQQKRHRRPHDGDDEIQLSADVLLHVVVAQHLAVLLLRELGGIQRFREELDLGVEAIPQRRTERLVEDCQTWASPVLVEEQEHALGVALARRRHRGWGERSDHAKADGEGQTTTTADPH